MKFRYVIFGIIFILLSLQTCQGYNRVFPERVVELNEFHPGTVFLICSGQTLKIVDVGTIRYDLYEWPDKHQILTREYVNEYLCGGRCGIHEGMTDHLPFRIREKGDRFYINDEYQFVILEMYYGYLEIKRIYTGD